MEPGGRSGEEAEDREATIDIEKLVGMKTCILLQGGAGSGKTTLVKHLAYTVTAGLSRPRIRGFLPVPVFLKDFWLIYSEVLQKNTGVPVFEELLAFYLEKIKCPLDWETVSAYLEQQRALFLIDGLDEVPAQLRTDLLEMVCRFRYAHKENIFLITGRPHGFDGVTGGTVARFGEEMLEILPLDNKKVEEFVKKWFRAISGRASGQGQVTAEAMIADLRRLEQEHISIFTRNPLLLTAVCILYQDGKRFPDQRADLYNRIIDNLVYRRFHNPSQPDREKEVLEFLMTLAYEAQKRNRKTIDSGDALTVLKQTFPQKPGEAEIHYQRRVQELYNRIEPACGLFNCLSSGEIEFIHSTYQEFLAARYMVYMDIQWEPFLLIGDESGESKPGGPGEITGSPGAPVSTPLKGAEGNRWWEETLLLYTGLNFPVVGVSWYEAAAYAAWLSKVRQVTGKPFRLPTEAQWEKAARGIDGREYPWSNEFDKNKCNSDESGLGRTSPVGIFLDGRSPYGCFDMAGNVWEWCADWYEEGYYKKCPVKNPQGPAAGTLRVRRGGSWFIVAELCACAIRFGVRPAGRVDGLGFRLARSL